MESIGKVKIKLIIKQANDNIAKLSVNKNDVEQIGIKEVVNLLESLNKKEETINPSKVIGLLEGVKHSHEVKALSIVDVDLEDAFEEEMKTVDSIDDLINYVNNL